MGPCVSLGRVPVLRWARRQDSNQLTPKSLGLSWALSNISAVRQYPVCHSHISIPFILALRVLLRFAELPMRLLYLSAYVHVAVVVPVPGPNIYVARHTHIPTYMQDTHNLLPALVRHRCPFNPYLRPKCLARLTYYLQHLAKLPP